jgi:hypothetical protein
MPPRKATEHLVQLSREGTLESCGLFGPMMLFVIRQVRQICDKQAEIEAEQQRIVSVATGMQTQVNEAAARVSGELAAAQRENEALRRENDALRARLRRQQARAEEEQ